MGASTCLAGAFLTTTLTFLCVGTTRLARIGGFPGADDPLDDAGRRDAARLDQRQRFDRILCSTARAARDTADAVHLSAEQDVALRDRYHGRWTGSSFADLDAAEGSALAQWLAEPIGAPPGGEELAAVQDRIGPWLDDIAGQSGRLCAITHPMTIRAALAHALDMPLPVTLAIDLAPLSSTRLSFNRRWRLQAMIPAD